MADLRENGLPLFAATNAPVVEDTHMAIATAPASARPAARIEASASFFERVALLVRVAAAANPAVSGAYLSRDGRSVHLVAPERTEELTMSAAGLISALRDALKPDAEQWIEGGFTGQADDDESLPVDCVWIYRRRRR